MKRNIDQSTSNRIGTPTPPPTNTLPDTRPMHINTIPGTTRSGERRLLIGLFAATALSGAAHAQPAPCTWVAGSPIGSVYCPSPGSQLRVFQLMAVGDVGFMGGQLTGCNAYGDSPAIWRGSGPPVVLPAPSSVDGGFVLSINAAGDCAGYVVWRIPPSTRPYAGAVWLDGQLTLITGTPSDFPAEAYGINDDRWVVGHRLVQGSSGTSQRGFIWRNGEVTDIDPTPWGYADSRCYAVSNSGIVAGHMNTGGSEIRAFRWKDGALSELELPAGAHGAWPHSINDLGIVAGRVDFPIGGNNYRGVGYVWNAEGRAIELPLPPGFDGLWDINGIDSVGTVVGVVGSSLTYASASVAWIHGLPYFVSQLLPASPTPNVGNNVVMSPHGVVAASLRLGTGVGGPKVIRQGASAADLNGDCRVDGLDLGILLSRWGSGAASAADCDFDWSGTVDATDLGLLLTQWAP